MTSEIEAAGMVVSGIKSYVDLQPRQYYSLKLLADAHLRETDPRLVDEAFIAGLAEVKRESNGWFADLTDAMRISCFVGRLRMRLWREGSVKAEIDIDNPTIGDFYTACRLFGITVTQTGAEA